MADMASWSSPRVARRSVSAACAALLWALATAAPASAEFGLLAKWGSRGTGQGQFNLIGEVAADPAGDVYVTDSSDGFPTHDRILKFSGSGEFLSERRGTAMQDGRFQSGRSSGLETDSSGNVYVAYGDGEAGGIAWGRIEKYSASGKFLTRWSRADWGGKCLGPGVLHISAADELYVTDGCKRIQRFTLAGALLGSWSVRPGKGEGEVSGIADLATDAAGNVYLADFRNGDSRIQKFTRSGAFLTVFPRRPGDDGWLNHVGGVATDTAGNVYATSVYNNEVQKFDSAGTFLSNRGGSFDKSTRDDGQFYYPQALATDCRGNVYVADNLNYRIQKFGETSPPSSPPCPPGPLDQVAPAMTSFALTPQAGTQVSFVLSEPATVEFTLRRARPGRTIGRRCVRPTRRNRNRPRCTRYVRLRGSFVRQGFRGDNRFGLSGRWRGRKLPPGRYQLEAAPIDAAANRGVALRQGFRIVRR